MGFTFFLVLMDSVGVVLQDTCVQRSRNAGSPCSARCAWPNRETLVRLVSTSNCRSNRRRLLMRVTNSPVRSLGSTTRGFRGALYYLVRARTGAFVCTGTLSQVIDMQTHLLSILGTHVAQGAIARRSSTRKIMNNWTNSIVRSQDAGIPGARTVSKAFREVEN